MQASAAP